MIPAFPPSMRAFATAKNAGNVSNLRRIFSNRFLSSMLKYSLTLWNNKKIKTFLVLFGRKWCISGSWEQCRWGLPATETPKSETASRSEQHSIHEIPRVTFFLRNIVLALSAFLFSPRSQTKGNMQHEKERWMYLVELVLGSSLFPCPFANSPHPELKKRSLSRAQKNLYYHFKTFLTTTHTLTTSNFYLISFHLHLIAFAIIQLMSVCLSLCLSRFLFRRCCHLPIKKSNAKLVETKTFSRKLFHKVGFF